MSGGGPSGDIGPSGPSERVDCQRLAFDTALASPDPGVVATLGVGDVLDIELRTSGGRRVIAAVTRPGGAVAGAITERTADLLLCTQQGVRYEAEITAISGGWVDVRIRAQ